MGDLYRLQFIDEASHAQRRNAVVALQAVGGTSCARRRDANTPNLSAVIIFRRAELGCRAWHRLTGAVLPWKS